MAVGVVVVASVAAFAVNALGDRGDGGGDDPDEVPPVDRAGSEEVDADGPLAIRDEPESYRVTYRIVQRGSPERTEVVTVQRPFVSETETFDGDGDLVAIERSAFGRLSSGDGDGDDVVFAVGPTVAGNDLRLAPALEEALDRGWLERREQRTVAGRRCQVYRAGTPIVGGTLAPPGDAEDEYADACFDAHGLLLEEWWVVEGEGLRQRIAVEVAEAAPDDLGADLAAAAPSMPVDKGGGSIQRMREGSAPPGPFFEPSEVPEGFTHLGRYSVIAPQADAFSESSANAGAVVASTADVWRRGIDLLVVDQGGALVQQPVFTPDPDNRTVELPGLGDAEVIITLTGNEVRLLQRYGRFVRVMGTLPPDELIDVAASLVQREGTEIVIDDGAPLLPG